MDPVAEDQERTPVALLAVEHLVKALQGVAVSVLEGRWLAVAVAAVRHRDLALTHRRMVGPEEMVPLTVSLVPPFPMVVVVVEVQLGVLPGWVEVAVAVWAVLAVSVVTPHPAPTIWVAAAVAPGLARALQVAAGR